MAEAVVSIALETLRDLLLEEGRFLSGVSGEAKALQTQLKEVKCLLEDADKKQHESKTVGNWIAEIRELAYRAEDAIETYAFHVSSRRGRGLKQLLRRFSCILNEGFSLHQIGSEISQIKSELAGVTQNMRDYGIKNIIHGESSSNDQNQKWLRQTFPSERIEDCFVGKEDDLKWLISLTVDDKEHRVISIYGMGGIGKTTIARKVYNHDKTKRSFESSAWVCITQQCQIRSVLEDVLKQLVPQKKVDMLNQSYTELIQKERDDISTLSDRELVGQLCEIQQHKRCLIVVDDLWETDHWNGLKHAFLVEGSNSKILLTTRKQTVADIGFPVEVGHLNVDDGWELLKKKAFPDSNINSELAFEERLLQKIGKEMVHKCGYLPLAISLLGGILSKRQSMREWELVNENIKAYLYRSDDIEKDKEVHAVLNLSYEDLPYYLKPCFLHMGLHKEDRRINARFLYLMWVAQGMISHDNRGKETSMDIAEHYLSELASRSIVEVEVGNMTRGSKYRECKLHDVVREVCLSTGKKDDFGVQTLDYQGGKFSSLLHESLSHTKTRHLAIHLEREIELELESNEFSISQDEDASKHLRSLLLFNDIKGKKIEFPPTKVKYFQKFKLLRVLVFKAIKFPGRKLPRGIGNLIHLRYLSLRECELDALPSSISKLVYLYCFDLLTTWNVRVPNVFKKMFRLRHLLLPSYSKAKIGNYRLRLDEGLDELETLVGFDSAVHELKSITRMKNLQHFSAAVSDNESLPAIINAITKNWKDFEFCDLLIKDCCPFTSTEQGLANLMKVFTCPNLFRLGIYVRIGKLLLEECRNQINTSKLTVLWLAECEIEDDPMEMLGKLPSLKELRLCDRSFVGEEMKCHALGFPCLKKLVLQALASLRVWRVEQGAMPLLSEIEISYCPRLEMVPDGLRFIRTLQKLTISEMPELGKRVLASVDDDGGEEGEDFDKVRHVPSIIIN